MFECRRATLNDLVPLAELFEAYRQFYECAADLEGASAYLKVRLERDESVVFVATADGDLVGFTQLYPSFGSLALKPVWVLYDLFVAPAARQKGVGTLLLTQAVAFANASGAAYVELVTAVDNLPAQSLYEKLGWQRDTEFLTYAVELGKK